MLDCIGYRMILCEFGGGPCPPYIVRGRLTSQLDLGDNQKVITDYRNHGIIRILTDLVVCSGYLPGVLRGAPRSAMLHKASSCGLGHPWGHSPCSLPWVSRVVPPTIALLPPIPNKFTYTTRFAFTPSHPMRLSQTATTSPLSLT